MKSCPECFSEYEDAIERCPDDNSVLKNIDKDPLVGTRLADRYEVLSVIGRGGMGVVYKVRHELMDRYMAVKMLHSHLVAETEAVKRFHREAKTVSAVKHHHIITLYDFGMSAQRQPYIVMDYLEGTSLKNVIKEVGPVPFERVNHIYQQVIDALATAHGMDLVHRDLKPENIMLSRNSGDDDWVTLVDFGLSKLRDPKQEDAYQITKVGDVCGSPPYMSPEQCLSSTVVDPRSDIYSLGICIYETLTGKLPFAAKSAIEMLDAHLYATPIPFNQALPELKVCSEITHVLKKALEKDPENRHQTVEEFGAELKDAISRDGLKLRTFKHRIEVANFKDLVSEAEALHKATLVDEARKSATRLEALNPQELEGMQFVRNKDSSHDQRQSGKQDKVLSDSGWMSHFQRKGKDEEKGDFPEIPGTCPHCSAAVPPGIKFCVNCQNPLTAGAVGALNTSRTSRETGQGRGFSSRAKKATSNSNSMALLQKVLAVVLVILLGYGGWMFMTNRSFKNSINKMMEHSDK